MKKVLLISILILGIIWVGLSILWNVRPAPDALSEYRVDHKEDCCLDGLTVQFLGNTNLVFSDGETSIMTDGFFTRPNAFTILFGEVEPDIKRVKENLHYAGLETLDAVIPLHSHFDHAMDAALVADLMNAQLIGSSSTINIGRAYGLQEESMSIPILNEPFNIGAFTLTFLTSNHWQYPDKKQRDLLLNQDIEEPLVTPASIFDYKEGISYMILLEHGNHKIAINGSAGFKVNTVEDFDADISFFSIAGLELMDGDYNQGYQTHVIDAVNPEVLVPIHWDDFTIPLSKGLKTTNVLVNFKMGSDLSKAFEIIESNNLPQNRKIKVLPLWERISVKELIEN